MTCEYCEINEGKREAEIIYQNDDLIVIVKDIGLTPGQMVVFPKQHFTIMEMVPDELIGKCSVMANKVSIACFYSLAAEGTNILVKNGTGGGQTVSHFGIDVIPRRSGDGINLEWQPLQLDDADLDIVADHIKKGIEKSNKPKAEELKKEVIKEAEFKEVKKSKDKNYLLKALQRI